VYCGQRIVLRRSDHVTPPAIACVFAKPPRAGTVKTRLARELGSSRAAVLASAFLEDTCAALRALPVRVVIATTEPWDTAPYAAELWLQGGGDLGQRLERVLRRALELGPWAVALGADSPGFPLEALARAELMLRESDVALGPARDGGFYLVALRRCPQGCFAGIPWSTTETLAALERRMLEQGLSTSRVQPWFDVDTLADLRTLEHLIASGRVVAPATANALASSAQAAVASGAARRGT
jgi:rSAM/selenodomain-associated transferase 1